MTMGRRQVAQGLASSSCGARSAPGGPPDDRRRGGLHPPIEVSDRLAGGRARGSASRRDPPPPRSSRCCPTEPPWEVAAGPHISFSLSIGAPRQQDTGRRRRSRRRASRWTSGLPTARAATAARQRAIESWPGGWYRTLMGDQMPPPVIAGDRSSAVDVHQLRAGHWSGSQQYMHRIGRNPTEECHQCSNTLCTPGWCIVCHEEGDTPSHVLLRCPALMRQRFLRHGTIIPSPEEVRDDGEVAALAAEMRSFQSRSATPRWRPAPRSAAGGTKQQQ